MTSRFGICLFVTLLSAVASVTLAQQDNNPWRSSPSGTQPRQTTTPAQTQPAGGQQYVPPKQAYPSRMGQPAAARPRPNLNPIQPGPQQPPWWPLAPAYQQYVDQVLKIWEQRGEQINVFRSRFAKRVHEPDHTGTVRLKYSVLGEVKYKKPDKGSFEIICDEKKRQDTSRAEKWICDGHSFYQYVNETKTLEQEILPPDQRGKMLSDGPVPFLFGAKAEKMKQLYWIRPLAAPKDRNEIWLEIWPRTQEGTSKFRRAEVRLSATDMRPVGVRCFLAGQQVRGRDGRIRVLPPSNESYTFYETVINPNSLTDIFRGNDFKAHLPSGWTKVVKQQPPQRPTALSGRQPAPTR